MLRTRKKEGTCLDFCPQREAGTRFQAVERYCFVLDSYPGTFSQHLPQNWKGKDAKNSFEWTLLAMQNTAYLDCECVKFNDCELALEQSGIFLIVSKMSSC